MFPTASSNGSAALPDLLTFIASTAHADGVLLLAHGPSGDSRTLASLPSGLAGRPVQLSHALSEVCGHGIQSAAKILLPSFITGWLGFRPGFVASSKLHWNCEGAHSEHQHQAEGCIFFFWREDPGNSIELAAQLAHAQRLAGSFAEREQTTHTLHQTQARLDAMLANVSLGIVFIDLLDGCRLNPVAATILDLPEATRDTASVVAALSSTRAHCTVEPTADVLAIKLDTSHNPLGASPPEYWISPNQERVLRVESHAVGSPQSPGRFWVFTDVKPLWDASQKIKSANAILERNLTLLNQEVDRRMEAEAELRRFNLGLKQKNEELEVAKLESDLIANQDALTGLANRRRFRQGLEDLVAHAQQTSSRVAVLYLDLDKFKAVNDTLGHERGDQLLRTVSDTLTRVLRKDDLIARLGGDEFGCALSLHADTPITDLTNLVFQLAQRLNIPVETPTSTIHVSASIGIALFPDDAEDATALLRAADNAMYLGKRQGGNEITTFSRRNDVVTTN